MLFLYATPTPGSHIYVVNGTVWDAQISIATLSMRSKPRAFKRLFEAIDIFDSIFDRIFDTRFGKRNYFILERMAVIPRMQGRGVGSLCLSTVLDRVVRPTGLPCVLSTQEEQNVTFYKRLGFHVLHEMDALNCHMWFMAWEPARQASKK